MMNSMCERVLPPLVFYGLCTYISFVVDSVCSCGEINALGSGQGASHVLYKYEPFCPGPSVICAVMFGFV